MLDPAAVFDNVQRPSWFPHISLVVSVSQNQAAQALLMILSVCLECLRTPDRRTRSELGILLQVWMEGGSESWSL